jgi:2,3-bisphosphoglycerate-independent phosphoglycerate mutase
MKKILVILDGASGLPIKNLNNKTPLESAKTPNLDFLAKNGKQGYMYPIDEKTIPGSDNSLIAIFQNNPKECKRGIYETIGSNVKFKKGNLALRTNFGTIENIKSKKVIDRRAGRTLTTQEANELSKTLNQKIKLPCEFEFKSTVQHRGVLVLKGKHSENISNIDNEWPNKKTNTFKFSKALDNSQISINTSNILNSFIEQSFQILKTHQTNKKRIQKGLLPANMLFTRGAGTQIPKLKQYKNWMSINSMPLEIGIAKLSGMKNFSFKLPPMKNIDAYKNLYKSLNQSIKFSKKIIKKQNKNFTGCYIQFKETDIPGHDNKPIEKKNMLELLDKTFFSFLKKFAKKHNINVVITCDHSTPCNLKSHSHHPVPVLLYNPNQQPDKTTSFSEKQSKKGDLGKFYGKDFMKKTKLI